MVAGCPHIPETAYRDFSESFHQKAVAGRIPLIGTFELTYRCNISCGHCYCNLPSHDRKATSQELNTCQWCALIDQIVDSGCLWLLLTGGEVLLRPDFTDIWMHAKKKGLLLTLFTNGTLLSPEIVNFLSEWPPFSLEITLYGMTKQTCEAVTGVPGSFDRCLQGIRLVQEKNLPLKLKTMALSKNIHELAAMKKFAWDIGVPFRFDAMVSSRLNSDKSPCQWRLSPKEVARLDMADEERLKALKEFCRTFMPEESPQTDDLFSCGAGVTSFAINPYGKMQICGMITEPHVDLKKSSFQHGWDNVLPAMRQQKASADFPCMSCRLYPLCSQCPGWAMTEHKKLDARVSYLCQVTEELAKALGLGGRK